MRYGCVVAGRFISRPNRFIARVEIDGTEHTVHVKNTGRCKELLVPGCTVYLAVADHPARKTAYDLIGVEKQRPGQPPLCINMDSQAPNEAVGEWLPGSGLFSPQAVIRREVTWGGSRFDFYVEDGGRRAFLEVKGVTLEQDGVAMFPDAPTVRGVKHLHELTAAVEAGYEAYVLFVVQMKEMHQLRPNDVTHPEFGVALRQAAAAGVTVLAVDCVVTPESMMMDKAVPVVL
ncbi:MAG: DNA/RNA nuclease SfsA [Clostridia bacterium]|nr:DNA/RNA nuclease SfsA [Clostridia bacterium]